MPKGKRCHCLHWGQGSADIIRLHDRWVFRDPPTCAAAGDRAGDHAESGDAGRMNVTSFNAGDIALLALQDEQEYLKAYMTPALAQSLEGEWSFTATHEGRIIGCGGLITLWENRALAWSYLSSRIEHQFIPLHRFTDHILTQSGVTRIEAYVACNFKNAHRWVKLLGFECEAPLMRKHSPDGRDHALYARVV